MKDNRVQLMQNEFFTNSFLKAFVTCLFHCQFLDFMFDEANLKTWMFAEVFQSDIVF